MHFVKTESVHSPLSPSVSTRVFFLLFLGSRVEKNGFYYSFPFPTATRVYKEDFYLAFSKYSELCEKLKSSLCLLPEVFLCLLSFMELII